MIKIAVIGTGYVGLVSGTCFAEFGYHVCCMDHNEEKINLLKQGKSPIYEPGLESLIQQSQHNQRLTFTTNIQEAVQEADAVFIAVGTPSREDNGQADLSYVFQAAKDIAPWLTSYTVIITKSTVPVGTGKKIKEIISEINPEADFDVASNPEFLREGSAIEDFNRPDRVIIGSESVRSKAFLQKLYRPLALIETPIVFTSLETSELIKYAANAFLATKIAFINEMADLCELTGADVQDVARAIGLDERIGRKFLHAGPGYGGSCFPKDTAALAYLAREVGTKTTIVEAVVDANHNRKFSMIEKIKKAVGGSVANKKIVVLGVTFKPNTDDMREAPSLVIVPGLVMQGAHVVVYDPVGRHEAEALLSGVSWANDPYEAMQGAHAVVILTEWNEFRALDFEYMGTLMNEKTLIDLRNIYKPQDIAAAGFYYVSVGREDHEPLMNKPLAQVNELKLAVV